MSLQFTIQAIGADVAVERLDEIARRMLHLRTGFEKVSDVLEAGEQRHFSGLRGKYVDTGALKASLTQDNANGAIREAHSDELIFGTSLFYARFQRKGRKNAVLVLKPIERKLSAKILLDHIVGR